MKLKFICPVLLVLVLLLPLISFSQNQPLIEMTSSPFNQGEYNLSIQNMPAGVDNAFWILGDGHFAYGLSPTHHLVSSNNNPPVAYLLKKYDPQIPTKVYHYGSNCCYGSGPSSTPNQNPSISMLMGQNLKIGTSWNPVDGQSHFTILTFERPSNLNIGNITLTFSGDVKTVSFNPIENNTDWYTNITTGFNNSISIDYSNMAVGEQRHFLIETTMKPNNPLNPNPTAVTVDAELRESMYGNIVSSNQSTFYTRRTPHDPNDKIVEEETICPNAPQSNTLTYTINFQNIGDDYAQNVLVRDDFLDLLNAYTVNVINSSHLCTVTTFPSYNSAEFLFLDAFLPGLNQTVPNKYTYNETIGSVKFTVETTSCLPEGELGNIATIWFDNQPAINTTWAYVPMLYSEATCGPINDGCNDLGFGSDNEYSFSAGDLNIYPNPVNDVFTIEYTLEGVGNNPLNLSIINSQGQVMASFQDELSRFKGINRLEVNASNWAKGIYFVKLDGVPEVQTWKFLKL